VPISDAEDMTIPIIQIEKIVFSTSGQDWNAELSVSTCADNPSVVFYLDDSSDFLLLAGSDY
jgi:hypothetical protein